MVSYNALNECSPHPHIRAGGGMSSVRSANTEVSQAIILLNPDYSALPPPPIALIIALSLCKTTHIQLLFAQYEMSGKIPHSPPCTKDLTFHCSTFEREREVGGAENTTAIGTLGALSILYFSALCISCISFICKIYSCFVFFSLLWCA